MRILYTGFTPFGGESVNPSFEALRLLPDTLAGAELMRLEIPTEFGRGAQTLRAALAEYRPEVVICVGQAGGRAAVTPELAALNHRHARIPDNAGFRPLEQPICADGPAAYFSRLPVYRIAERLRERGIPAAVSYSAGTYVCNELMYCLLREAEREYPAMVCGFIHVPYSLEQAAAQAAPAPGMPLALIAEALRLAGELSVEAARAQSSPTTA